MKLKGLSAQETECLLPAHCRSLVTLAYRGSIAHGMYIPNSDPNSVDDKDLMGVFVAPDRHYLGFGCKETVERKLPPWDVVHYELRKFVGLLLKSNPNVLSLLWVNERYILHQSDIGRELREKRQLFVSKQAYHSFTGYAYSQLHRMTSGKCEGYMGEKRKALVEKFGFDCKNGAHLVRLLKMGIEFLVEGELHVEREDAAQLLEIKRGEWTLDQVKAEAQRLFVAAEMAYVRSTLPAQPRRDEAETMLMGMLREELEKW